MKFLLPLLSCLALLDPAYAEQAPAPRTFKFEVTEAELGVIGKGLEGLPFREAAPVINKLQQQLNEQVKPPAPEPKPDK